MKKDRSKERTQRYRERLAEKKQVAAEQASEIAQMRELNLCCFSEVGYDTPARNQLEEVQAHRSWLRALEQPDVQPGETLRQVARRTWQALLNSKDLLVSTDNGGEWIDGENGRQWVPGYGVCYPLFDPRKQHFQFPFDSNRFPDGPFCEAVRDGAKPEWFDQHWRPPGDCSGDEPIDPKSLRPLPPINVKKLEPKLKPLIPPPTADAPPIVTGLETPLEEQNRLNGFGTFGMTRSSHEPG
jgi:hypothetical protein